MHSSLEHEPKTSMHLENVVIKDPVQGYCTANLTIGNGCIEKIEITSNDHRDFLKAEFYITPGFVNSHLHPNQLLDRRMLDELSITELLHQMHGDYKKNDEERHSQALFVLMEAVKSGATSAYSVASNPFPVIRAYKTLGIKGAVTCFYNDQWEGHGDSPALSLLRSIEEQFTQAYEERTDNIDIHIGSASVESASNDLLILLDSLAKRFETKVNIHVSEGTEAVNSCLKSRQASPVRLLSKLKVLARHWNLIHAVTIDEEEVELIAQAGAHVIHCPVSNAKTGVGVAPIKSLMAKGVKLGLGSDACSNNNTNNILNEAYFAILLQAAFQQNAQAIPTETLMQWITENGHQILGTGQKGTIEIGEPADLLLWSLQENAFVPLVYGKFDSALIYNAPDIKPHTVLINGKTIVESYQFKVIPEADVRSAANHCGSRIYQFKPNLLPKSCKSPF